MSADPPPSGSQQRAADLQLQAMSVAAVVVDAWRERLSDPTLPATEALSLLLDLMCPAIEGALDAAEARGRAEADQTVKRVESLHFALLTDAAIVDAMAVTARNRGDLMSEAAYAITSSDFEHMARRLRAALDGQP